MIPLDICKGILDDTQDMPATTHIRMLSAPARELSREQEDGPVWIQIAEAGDYRGYPGGMSLQASKFEAMVSNFGLPIPMKYGHDTEAGAAKAGAAGWITALDIRGSGLWACVEWTERARGMIRAGEHRHVSIEFSEAWPDARSGEDQGCTLHAVALTLEPFIAGMQPIAASLRTEIREMDESQGLIALQAALDEAGAEVADLDAWLAEHAVEIVEFLTSEKSSDEAQAPEIAALSAKLDGVQRKLSQAHAQIATLQSEREAAAKRAIEAEVDGAIERGALAPAKRDEMIALGAHSVDMLRSVIETIEGATPPARIYSASNPADQTALSAQQERRARLFEAAGLSREKAIERALEMEQN